MSTTATTTPQREDEEINNVQRKEKGTPPQTHTTIRSHHDSDSDSNRGAEPALSAFDLQNYLTELLGQKERDGIQTRNIGVVFKVGINFGRFPALGCETEIRVVESTRRRSGSRSEIPADIDLTIRAVDD